MALCLIPLLKEANHSSARLVWAKSLKDGMRVLPSSRKDRKLLSFAHLIMPTAHVEQEVSFLPMLLLSSKLNFLTLIEVIEKEVYKRNLK